MPRIVGMIMIILMTIIGLFIRNKNKESKHRDKHFDENLDGEGSKTFNQYELFEQGVEFA